MGAQIAERSGARLGTRAAPAPGHVRIVEEALVEPAPEARRLADVAPLDELLCQQRRRGLDVVEGDHRPDALPVGGICQRPGVRELHRQGLFAIDVLACLDRRHRHLEMQGVGRRDVDHVDLGIGDHRAPVGGRPGEAEAPGGRRGLFLGRIGQRMQHGNGRKVTVEKGGAPEGVGMGLPHEARPDQADVERLAGHAVLMSVPKRFPGWCRRRSGARVPRSPAAALSPDPARPRPRASRNRGFRRGSAPAGASRPRRLPEW